MLLLALGVWMKGIVFAESRYILYILGNVTASHANTILTIYDFQSDMYAHKFDIFSLSRGPMQDKDKNKTHAIEHTGFLLEVQQNIASSSGQAKAERHYDYYDSLQEIQLNDVDVHNIHTRSEIDSDICNQIRTLLITPPKLKRNNLRQYARKLVRMQLRYEDKEGNPKVSLEFLQMKMKFSWLLH